ncbi:MAG: hypothetical protein OXU61_01755 [Gammaproteobacteria bacterium]|nr:hypothetical protein [Gammaproteobacteria bacterium]
MRPRSFLFAGPFAGSIAGPCSGRAYAAGGRAEDCPEDFRGRDWRRGRLAPFVAAR